MNKKKVAILAASMLLLAACGTKPTPAPTESSADAPTSEKQESTAHKHSYGEWKETEAPTCTEKGKKERTCECGEKQTQDVPATGHSMIDVAGGKEATCGEDGVKVQECGVCHERVESPIPAKGHTWVDDGAIGTIKKQKCSECGKASYTLAYADSTRTELDTGSSNIGATEKLKNGVATWDLTSLPRAKFEIWGNVKSTAGDHGDRKWYNMATSDPVEETRTSNADTADMPKYRYHFEEEPGTVINPTNKNSREEDGITNTDFAWCKIVDAADLGGEEFKLVHDGMGYSMVWDSIRLVEVGEAEEPIMVTFNCDSHCYVEIFRSQDYSKKPNATTKAYARDSETGQIDSSGEGQVNFRLVIDEGYTIDSMKGSPADNFKSLKAADGDGSEGIYKVTKITDEVTVTIKTKVDTGVETGFKATFVHPAEYPVTVYPTQDITVGGEVTDTALVRTKAGLATDDPTAEGQLNFVIGGVVPDGKTFKVTATSGTYNKIKADPEGDGNKNFYRITKITADIVVTITIEDIVAN